MLIDVTNAEHYWRPENLPKDMGVPFEPISDDTYVAADYWSEHCVECGAPACYKTCEQFVRTPARTCSRFLQGMRPVLMPDGTTGVSVHFRPWGKMELDFSGNMISFCKAKIRKLDLWLSAFVRILNRITNVFAPFGTRTMISVYRHIRDISIRNCSCKCCVPNVWRIKCYVAQPTTLFAAVATNKDGEIFLRELHLSEGWNKFQFDIPELAGECYFRLYSIEGTPSPVVFSDLMVLRISPSNSHAEFVKCVVWDLDNTLWSGILAEDEVSQIKLRSGVLDIIKELDRRGIVNSICSKNDYAPAWKKLEEFGVAKYIVFPHINWHPKSANIMHLVKEMNIGIDSLAFIDDSEWERGEVASACPQVRVFSESDIGSIIIQHPFNPPKSALSSKRRLSYQAEMRRKDNETIFEGSHEEFIRECEIELVLSRLNSEEYFCRCWELVNRTNQLTLAARRYEKKQFEEFVNRHECYAISCRDKYGDYGIVGFIAINWLGDVVNVDEFVMSCRVAKKFCEQSVLLSIAKVAKSRGYNRIIAEIVSTGRNGALIEAFDKMPFTKTIIGQIVKYDMPLLTFSGDSLFCNKVNIASI